MEPHLLSAFQMQIWIQCCIALDAYEDLPAGIASMEAIDADRTRWLHADFTSLPLAELDAKVTEMSLRPRIRPWSAIQTFLTAVANISKACWGSYEKPDVIVRRESLRESLAIADDSPIRPKHMRHNFDHFDERLDKWWKDSEGHNRVDLTFTDMPNAYVGVSDVEMFRNYNETTGDVEFWGQRYNLPEIVAELERIRPLALYESAQK